MPTPRVIDLSHHNTVPSDFKATKAAGVVGIIHKCTEGTSVVDSKVQARRWLAKDAGLAWGLYHFLRPSSSMKQQADFFLKTAQSLDVIDGETLLVADHEDAGVSGQQLKEFLDYLEDATDRSPVVYSGHVLKDQLKGKGYKPKRRLWLCQYTSGTPSLPEGVDRYWLWQYTDKGSIAGVNSPVDLNHFDGEVDAFLTSWTGTLTPEPAPQPGAPQVELTLTSTAPVDIHIKTGEGVTVTVGPA